MLKLMYITNKPYVAQIVEQAGVDRVFIDLEYLGKEERQPGMDTVKSGHRESDICAVKQVLRRAQLLVRINPINGDSEREINSVIEKGADIIMLPMFRSTEEVKRFFRIVAGRVPTILLLEHIDAVKCLDDILEIQGIHEIHIGLNDLHLSMNLTFMFELLTNGVVDDIAKKLRRRGIPFGIGGIGRIGTGTLPAEMILTEHYRLHSTGAILSRSFCNVDKIKDECELHEIFAEGVMQIRDYEQSLLHQDALFFEKNKAGVKKCVDEIVYRISKGQDNGK